MKQAANRGGLTSSTRTAHRGYEQRRGDAKRDGRDQATAQIQKTKGRNRPGSISGGPAVPAVDLAALRPCRRLRRPSDRCCSIYCF
jgi:hypothetical protein